MNQGNHYNWSYHLCFNLSSSFGLYSLQKTQTKHARTLISKRSTPASNFSFKEKNPNTITYYKLMNFQLFFFLYFVFCELLTSIPKFIAGLVWGIVINIFSIEIGLSSSSLLFHLIVSRIHEKGICYISLRVKTW